MAHSTPPRTDPRGRLGSPSGGRARGSRKSRSPSRTPPGQHRQAQEEHQIGSRQRARASKSEVREPLKRESTSPESKVGRLENKQDRPQSEGSVRRGPPERSPRRRHRSQERSVSHSRGRRRHRHQDRREEAPGEGRTQERVPKRRRKRKERPSRPVSEKMERSSSRAPRSQPTAAGSPKETGQSGDTRVVRVE